MDWIRERTGAADSEKDGDGGLGGGYRDSLIHFINILHPEARDDREWNAENWIIHVISAW